MVFRVEGLNGLEVQGSSFRVSGLFRVQRSGLGL